jgi:hypothetical protein
MRRLASSCWTSCPHSKFRLSYRPALSDFSSQRRQIEANTVLFIDAGTSCLQKPSANAKELPLHLKGQIMSLEDSTNRKPSRLDHFCDSTDLAKPYLWEEFTSATPTLNKDQKRIDLSKDTRWWYYLGKPSTESKAQYTDDPTKNVNNPASNFLQSVEPAKRPLISQSQPIRRQSLPASYPGQFSIGFSVRPTNAAMVSPRLTQVERLEKQKMDDYQRRMAILGAPAAPASPAQYFNSHPAASNQSSVFASSDQARNPPFRLPADPEVREAMLAKQRAILERSQQRAMKLDLQDRPYTPQPTSSVPPANIGIDTQSIDRQREFQRRAYQQSLASTQLSSHSPGMQAGFVAGGPTPRWGQYSNFEAGTSYAADSQSSANTARYGEPSPSPTDAAFPILRRPHHQPISSTPEPQYSNRQLHTEPFSSQQQPLQVDFSQNQRRFFQPTYPYPQLLHRPQNLSPLHNLNMSSRKPSSPIDIPQQSNMSGAFCDRNLGQHTANFIDPNLMQLSPNNQTSPALSDMAEANRDKAVQASRSMPPPPVPSQSSHPAAIMTSGQLLSTSKWQDRYLNMDYEEEESPAPALAPAPGPKIVTAFYPKMDEVYADMKKKEKAQKPTLINDKPVPQSIATLGHMSKGRNSRPNIYGSPYSHGYGSANGATIKEGTTTYGRGLLKVDEVDEDNALDDEEWLQVDQTPPNSKEDKDASLDSDFVHVDIKRDTKAVQVKKNKIDPVGGGLANSYYAARSTDEQKKIDGEKKSMGWMWVSDK